MVTANTAVDKEVVYTSLDTHDVFNPDGGKYETTDNLGDDLGGFSSIDDLEDFLRTFEAGSEDEATVSTQGEGDVAGEPLSTVH